MTIGAGLLVALAALLAMELVAYLAHRYVMHGWMWRWHESHHTPRPKGWRGWFELNDLFAAVFALVSIGLFYWGSESYSLPFWLGLGMAGYGLIYVLFHDGLVHGRIPLPRRLKRIPYLRHLVQAHYLHHATHEQHGAVSYGFMVAPPLDRLRAAFRTAAKVRRTTYRHAAGLADSGPTGDHKAR